MGIWVILGFLTGCNRATFWDKGTACQNPGRPAGLPAGRSSMLVLFYVLGIFSITLLTIFTFRFPAGHLAMLVLFSVLGIFSVTLQTIFTFSSIVIYVFILIFPAERPPGCAPGCAARHAAGCAA